jgi:hypothetical protein
MIFLKYILIIKKLIYSEEDIYILLKDRTCKIFFKTARTDPVIRSEHPPRDSQKLQRRQSFHYFELNAAGIKKVS